MTDTRTITIHSAKGQPEPAVYIVDADLILEIVEEEGLEGDAAQRAVEDILMVAEEIDLNALARFVVEQTDVELADYEEDE